MSPVPAANAPEISAAIIVALMALGMALAFLWADRRSPTSRAMSLFLTMIGLSMAVGVMLARPLHWHGEVPVWSGLLALPEALTFVFGAEWLLLVRRTVPAGNLNTRGADLFLRVAQALAGFYGLASLLFPRQRLDFFINILRDADEKIYAWFYLFALPLGLALLLTLASGLLLLNRKPDRAEAMRGLAFLLGAPFMASAMLLPLSMGPMALTIGLMIFLVGAVQYHVTQGRRAQFLARFMAPQVAEMVARRGLRSATDEQTLELSVVSCDLRGFTAFSAATSSKRVIQILREYYDAVGAAATAYGGTIKDQAGDGVLILVGAPLPFADHAQRAIEMAQRIRKTGVELTQRWSDGEMQLGVGVGVASGFVTVGVIGAASRLEYTAVGPAVNLASRLCSEAAHAEILVAPRTRELLGEEHSLRYLGLGEALRLKGFADPVQSYLLAA